MEIAAPWLNYYGEIPAHLDYPDISMFDMVCQTADKSPDIPAMTFYGKATSYRNFVSEIRQCARALRAAGVQPGDRVSICMPNCPQALVMFYAVNCIGAVSNMIHPLSAEEEIAGYINGCGAVAALTLDQFYPKFQAVWPRLHLKKLIIARIKDALPTLMGIGYGLTTGRKLPQIQETETVQLWNHFLDGANSWTGDYQAPVRGGDVASILYSGGTTGTTKGILLTNLNFNALSMQTAAACCCLHPGHKMLAIMPIFHGFGLGICIHTVLTNGATCILVPQFTAQSYAQLLKKHRPNYIAGVPTLFEALLRLPEMEDLDLSCLEGVFSGGDSLSVELKRKVDAYLQSHGAKVQVREGYGTTECVTASCLTPPEYYREGSIGIPFPDTYYKIVNPTTHDTVAPGELGEICLSGPTVMLGYMDNPKETAAVLQRHADGLLWLHTGDLGSMDEDGFVYFKQRLKRVIISSGYNIYPSQLENVIDAHPDVLMSTVIGVKDKYRMQRAKAFVVLKPGVELTPEVKRSILEHCKKRIARYAMPKEFEFRDDLPRTLVGKVAYTVLEREEADRQAAKEAAAAAQAAQAEEPLADIQPEVQEEI